MTVYPHLVFHQNVYMYLIPYEELWSKWGVRRRKQLSEFIMAWVIRARVEEMDVKKLHVRHAYVYATVSVPKFMKGRLFSHLGAFGIVFKEVSVEYRHVCCQNCGNKFRFRSTAGGIKSACPSCGSISFVR